MPDTSGWQPESPRLVWSWSPPAMGQMQDSVRRRGWSARRAPFEPPCLSASAGSAAVADLETAARPSITLAALARPTADDFRDGALHREAHARIFAGHRRQRTAGAANHVAAVPLDVGQRAQLLVEQRADLPDARLQRPGRFSSAR